MIVKPKGTKDVLPDEAYAWQFLESVARQTAKNYAFREIRTPVFEYTELFSRGVGDTSDIVNKEMYTFLDKGGRSVTLRPEGTAGVARAFLENGLAGGAMPFKAYYLISSFRYERPQAGRLRQFHQFGAELYGSSAPYADAEAIIFADAFLKNIGLKQVELRLNSIGCSHCRARYHEALKAFFAPHIRDMCEDCRTRFEKNPMRILDCKEEACKKISASAPRMIDYLCEDCRAHFESVQSLLNGAGVSFTVDANIVRGLDYYSRTVFEFKSEAAGAQGTVLGGGRYDTLLSQIGGKDVPAVGFAAGMERLLLVMQAENAMPAADEPVCCYLLGMDDASRETAFALAQTLRGAGISCEVDLMERSLKAQFKYADKIKARFTAVIGEEEVRTGAVQIKDMHTSASETVNFKELAQYLIKRT